MAAFVSLDRRIDYISGGHGLFRRLRQFREFSVCVLECVTVRFVRAVFQDQPPDHRHEGSREELPTDYGVAGRGVAGQTLAENTMPEKFNASG